MALFEFQSTLPRGERPSRTAATARSPRCFNPRSRAGSDNSHLSQIVTKSGFNPRSRAGSDSHRADAQRAPGRGNWCFNPRSRAGSDLVELRAVVADSPVSIHAPARGATATAVASRPVRLFQSTLPRGERPAVLDDGKPKEKFQSTLPRGERQVGIVEDNVLHGVSIHAPARGATGRGMIGYILRWSFNPRSRAGSDRNVVLYRHSGSPVSIHAPARGATFCGPR